MNKAFTREPTPESEEDEERVSDLPVGTKNYMTPAGYAGMTSELAHLVKVERPEVVNVVAWAASNGDRSENGDYIYGKKRLREIDRRIRFLTKRIEHAVVVDPAGREVTDQIFFGATVTVRDETGDTNTYAIVGIDEAEPARGRISWISPLARTLIKAREGDTVRCPIPGGVRELEILSVEYLALD